MTSDSENVALLRRDALFADLSGSQVARLLGYLHTVEFAAGDVLYAKDTPAKFLYLIESGELQLTTPSGREVALTGLRCGEEAASDTTNYLCSVTAATPVRALQIPRDALAELAAKTPSLRSKALLALMGYVSGETFLKPTGAEKEKKKAAKPVSTREVVGWLGVVLVPPAIYFLSSMNGLVVEAAVFLAILSATVLMWLFNLADEFVPPLVAITAVLIVGLVPSEIALAGFSSRTLTTLVGVYALAAVISASGLSYRFMLWLLIRLPDTPFWHQAALLLSGYILSPIMPSGNARLSLVLPFYRDMIDGLNLPAQSKSATALMAATFSGAMLFSPMLLTSKSSNLTAFGMLPVQLQDQFQGLFWFVAAGVAALTVTAAHLVVVRLCFGRSVQAALPKARLEKQLALLGPVTKPEKAALTGFLFFLIGAGTAGWHQISPAWLAAFLLVGLLVMGLLSKKDFQQKIDWPMIFFLLSLDGLSRAITYLGLDTALAQSAGNLFDFVDGRMIWFIPVALVVTLLLRLVLPITAGMVVAAVILIPIGQAQFINPWVVVFLTAMFSDIWFVPYQSSQYLQVQGSGLDRYYKHTDFLRYNHWMNLSRLLAAYLSIPYWEWLGLV
ncbi:SLC13 family permease [Polaromonas sp. YR568]|uniref:SLC13 family permease n=1 Tax=Polaromonas sp. YR568 TaxID=1855301 RepID=UPI0015874956|nr:SLC13 family permease [Polaromonas sp. YR568]